MSPTNLLPIIELNIDSTAFGGKGIARRNGKVYFVENAIEGDLVRAQVTDDNERYGKALVVEVLASSPSRGPSPCSFSHECGGCQWQGVAYQKQLDWKKSFVVSSLQRIGKLGADLSCEILGSANTQAYRNRIMVRARVQTNGRIIVGYFKRASREFVSINQCLIAAPRLNEFIERVAQLQVSPPPSEEIKFRFEMQDLPAADSSEPHLLLSVYEPDQGSMSGTQIAKQLTKAGGVLWAGSVKSLPDAPFFRFETDLGIDFYTGAGLFQQVNVPHNHVARRLVLDVVKKYAPKNVLDIFCGSGNLSLAVAKSGVAVQGVEFSKRAIDCAKYNCEKNQINNAEYFAGDTKKFLRKLAKSGERYEMVIADPPRDGMYQTLPLLKDMAPKYIVYISCDPTTLARDLGSLCKTDYRIVELKALDFFPNTYHIESFVVLERIL